MSTERKSIVVARGPTKQHVESRIEEYVSFGGHEIKDPPVLLDCGT